MKKIISFVLAVIMLLSVVPITASADTYSGTCGENVTWTYNTSTYTLTISGTGAMYDYYSIGSSGFYYHSNRPWESYEDSVKKVVVKNGVTTIGKCAFDDFASLKSVSIGDSVTSIGFSAFRDCDSLTNITIPDSVTSIDNFVFHDSDVLTNVTIPDSVTSIGENAFAWCDSLERVTIGDGVTTIGEDAFAYCRGLKSVTIGDSVTTIGDYAFSDCTSLTEVNIKDISAWCNISFNGYYSNPLYFAKTLKINGKKVTDLIIPDGVTEIKRRSFFACNSLTRVIIPDSVITIGDSAFWWCDNLTNVTIGDNVETIGTDAFYHCDSLTRIAIPDSVTSIGEFAFSYCDRLENVYYSGTEDEWKTITIASSNDPLLNATIHFNHTEHTNNDDDGLCDECGSSFILSFECNHNCHKGGISGFFWKISNFFNRIFGTKKYCECGVAHY